MNVSTNAETRLKKLLPAEAAGFSVTGYVGTCRGSTPVIKPASGPLPEQKTLECRGLCFYVNPDIADQFRDCTLDYDPALFGKGLTATWPHRAGCACNHG